MFFLKLKDTKLFTIIIVITIIIIGINYIKKYFIEKICKLRILILNVCQFLVYYINGFYSIYFYIKI